MEPRFLFACSTHKAHVSFAPNEALEALRDELRGHHATMYTLMVPYSKPPPEDLIRRIAEYGLRS